MSEDPHHSGSSLEAQICEREAHLLLRHRAVAARANQVTEQFKRKVASPVVLLAAFGSGFVIERAIRLIPRRSRRAASQAQGAAQQKPGRLARLMEILILARSLLTAWPTSLTQRLISMRVTPPQAPFRRTPHYEPASAPVYPVDADFYP
jgi:hypothetical protein